jgi:galactokinase
MMTAEKNLLPPSQSATASPVNLSRPSTNEHIASRNVIRCVAPARVNLLGEHTDYTGGLVLPMAIPFTTEARIALRSDGRYGFTSELFPNGLLLDREDRSEKRGVWTDYPVGVLRQLQAARVVVPAFDLHLAGNVPFGAGVSSSASVEVASAMAMLALAGEQMPMEQIAVMCRRAENEYVHSPCGIMDQFAITAAKAGHALLLDTRSLTYEHLPMNQGGLADTVIVVVNSMVRHSVATGEYGVRRRQSEEGQLILLRIFPELRDLGDATLEHLEAARGEMSVESYKRCRHLISDNGRVREARVVMNAGDPVAFGRLMLAGHVSERDDFECSCEEVDFLVETAAAQAGCFGARLTGGGFGGCTVNLVAREKSAAFAEAVKAAYKQRFEIAADTFVCDAVDGAWIRNKALLEVGA